MQYLVPHLLDPWRKTEKRSCSDPWAPLTRNRMYFTTWNGEIVWPIRPGGGGGGTPPYKLYRHVPPQRIGNLVLFCLKTGIHFAHFGLESGKVRPVFVDKN